MLRSVFASSWPAFVLTLSGIVTVLLRFDVPAIDQAQYAAYLAFAAALPGVFAWRALLASLHRRDAVPTWLEDLTLGTIFGFTLQVPFFLAGVASGVPALVLTPAALAAVLSFTPWGRSVWRLPTRRFDPRGSWVLGAVISYGVLWMAWNDFDKRPLSVSPSRVASIDETFHLALVTDLGTRFPAEFPWLLGTPLEYHWFVHAQVATSTSLTGLEPTAMLRLVLPTMGLVLGVLGLAAVARRLSNRTVAAVIAPALLVAGGYHLMGPDFSRWLFYEPFLGQRFLTSPSQAYGVAVSMPVLMLVMEVLRPGARPRAAVWLALGVALLGLAGAKASFLPVFLCGALGVWGVELLRRRRMPWRATLLSLLMASVFAFSYLVLLGGQSDGMDFSPFTTMERALRVNGLPVSPRNTALMTFATLTGWLLYGVGVVGLARKLLDPRAIFLLVAIPAGVTVPFLLFRTGLSQLWFSRAVAELVVLLSAWGMARVLPRPLSGRQGLLYAGLAVVAGAGAYAVSWTVQLVQGTGHARPASLLLTVAVPIAITGGYLLLRLLPRLSPRIARPPLAVLLTVLLGLGVSNVFITLSDPQVPGPKVIYRSGHFPRGGIEAAEYVEAKSPGDALVATNVHCLEPAPARCDFRSFWIAAYTERRVLVEGWGYTPVAKEAREALEAKGLEDELPVPYPERLALNDAVFTDPTEENLRRLVDTYGVDWLLVGKAYDADLHGLYLLAQESRMLTREFRSGKFVVYRVED